MDYTNPKLNIIIFSPGRTGSTLIWDILSQVTRKTPIRRTHKQNVLPMSPKECLHSHDPNDIKLSNENTFYIVSKRNLIDSAISSAIATNTGKFEYYKKVNYQIEPFVLDKHMFMMFYESKKLFYKQLKDILPANHIIIDYKEFENDLHHLFLKLNLDTAYLQFFNKSLLKQKTPGSYQDYIINFDEILSIAKNLDPNPDI